MVDTAATAVPPRIAPPVGDESQAFWTGGSHGELLISYCAACRHWVHPPTGTCPTCSGPISPEAVSGRGSVFTYSVVRHQFHPDVPPPVVVAIVELDEQPGLRFTTNIVNCNVNLVEIGMRVRVLFEQAGEAWVPVFEPDQS